MLKKSTCFVVHCSLFCSYFDGIVPLLPRKYREISQKLRNNIRNHIYTSSWHSFFLNSIIVLKKKQFVFGGISFFQSLQFFLLKKITANFFSNVPRIDPKFNKRKTYFNSPTRFKVIYKQKY